MTKMPGSPHIQNTSRMADDIVGQNGTARSQQLRPFKAYTLYYISISQDQPPFYL